jgi:glycosyltransferase involved in cell wall biosynthesis
MKIKKITFLTYHNWDTKRQGGFHQFAKYTCSQGIETVFFSFSRPYYIFFKKEERLNRHILKKLSKGLIYEIEGHPLINVTWPTFALPGFLRKFVSTKLNSWLMSHSLTSFKRFARKWLKDTDCFVFESTIDIIMLLDLVIKYYPNAKIIYRPSDPIVDSNTFTKQGKKLEQKMIEYADQVLAVNNESIILYKKTFPEINNEKFHVISNGANISAFQKTHACPNILQNKKTALYIGAFPIDWNVVIKAAKKLPNIYFVIIYPVQNFSTPIDVIDKIDNIIYIPGIKSIDIPQWVTNANLIVAPLRSNHKNRKALGLTAKNYQAMAAKKPIVTYNIPASISKYGIITTSNIAEFIDAVSENISKKNIEYRININEKNWSNVSSSFLSVIK